MLCDTFEAVIGAIYLNLGIEAVENFITPFLEKASDEIILNRKNEDPKSRLQEWAQAQGYSTPDYSTIGESGPEHEKIFSVQVSVNGKVYGVGSGHNKQAATKAAAIAALTKLNILEE
jgi:ribonuclease-3